MLDGFSLETTVSIDLVAAALWLPLNPTRKLVLVSLCENADQYGLCWPSRPYIARRCSLSERSVVTHLHGLRKDKWLRIAEAGRRGFSTRRQLDAQRILREGEVERQSFYLLGWGEDTSPYSGERGEDGAVRVQTGDVRVNLLHYEPS